MASAYGEADLVLSRAGATTVAEITACGKPAILIPFPQAAHGHQEKNALALEAAGAARVVLQKDDPRALERMALKSRALGKPEAGRSAAALGIELAEGRGGGAGV
jgi:UDP-N-acetylglucosamine--N-acetylmuramyl-(pentapeptide) pyrophosphoryl-undecaprenol N-acetylglucosamine transferase